MAEPDLEIYEANAPGTAVPPRSPLRSPRALASWARGCWATAVVLLVLAPFYTLYSQPAITAHGALVNAATDGWGRTGALGATSGHELRFGIALYVVATLLAGLIAWSWSARPRSRAVTAIRAGALVLPALLFGVVGTGLLYLRSFDVSGPAPASGWTLYSPASTASYGSTLSVDLTGSAHITPGSCCWLTVAALVALVIGSALFLVLPSQPNRTTDVEQGP